MSMAIPENSVAMLNVDGPSRSSISLGSMACVLKVWDGLTSHGDPGWFLSPEGRTARRVTASEVDADG